MASLVTPLFRAGAMTVDAPTSLVDHELLPDELAYIRNAVPKRRAEFGTARILARRALASLGFSPVSLVPRKDRSPVWPAGVVGSITHTSDYCAVVVDRAPPLRAVGLDVERLRTLVPGTTDHVLTHREQAWIDAQEEEARADLAILVFSAKEAYYKCQYPISSMFLEFAEVDLEVDRAAGRFEARASKGGMPPCVQRLEGTFVFAGGMVLCGVELYA